MLYHFDRIEKDFGAMEAAELTGVSQVMQRDWRRHGYLPPPEKGRRFRFSLIDLCVLGLMKAQVDGGKSVGGAHTVAKLCFLSALIQIELCPAAVRIDGLDMTDEEKRGFARQNAQLSDGSEASRYLFFINRTSVGNDALNGDQTTKGNTYHFANLAEMEEKLPRDWMTGQIFDLENFARVLAAKAGEPLITYRVRSVDE